MEEYEDIGQEKIEAQNSQTDNQINSLLDNLDSRGQQEIAYGYDLFELGSTTQNLLYYIHDYMILIIHHVTQSYFKNTFFEISNFINARCRWRRRGSDCGTCGCIQKKA